MTEKELIGKILLGKPKLKDVKMIKPELRWREPVEDSNRWQDVILVVWY